uniref:Methyltransferase FkbM domain-containing protein n=1 Tax=viral metagenome TaxID=1070528 RepID=A0A6C0BA37_9ZZZZ
MNSFDVFDTIIGRLCYKGTKIFDIIEKITGIQKFSIIRQKCEREGIDNIYSQIHTIYPNIDIESLKKLELQLEYDFSFPIWKYLNKINSNDILISDMYLSKEDIYKLIQKHKSIENNLFVTSGGKSSGHLWDNKTIVDNIILHTGDNKISDYINPMSRNIPSEWVSNVDFNTIEFEISKNNYEVACLIRATRLTLQHENDFMYESCTLSLIPLSYLISLHIKKQVEEQDIKEVIFLSRDGYWIYTIFKLFFPTIKCKYVYVSRLLTSNPLQLNKFINLINENNDKKILVDLYGSGTTVNTFLNRLINTTYLLCVSWDTITPLQSNNLRIIRICNKYSEIIEKIFSAPHGSINHNGILLQPEYDITIFKPYMITINLFKNYYNTYTKYDTIHHNCFNVSEIINTILTMPCEKLLNINNIVIHNSNHDNDKQSYPITYFSQIEQDKYYIENIIKFKCNGVFLDIGAYDGITGSNTYFLEKYLNWSGVLVECNPNVINTCRMNRTNPICNKAIFNTEGTVEFLIPKGDEMVGGKEQLCGIKTSLKKESLVYFSNAYSTSEIINVETITLNNIFKLYNLTIVDYMSIDIEGGELNALLNFDFEKYKILFITIEHGCIKEYQQQIYNFLISKGYKLHRNNKWDDEYYI